MPQDDSQQPATKADLEAAVGRVLQTVAAEFSQTREEFRTELDRRFTAVERRMDRVNEYLSSIDLRMGALNKWADTLDRDNGTMLGNQAAQQRAIDDLARRVTRLEERSQQHR